VLRYGGKRAETNPSITPERNARKASTFFLLLSLSGMHQAVKGQQHACFLLNLYSQIKRKKEKINKESRTADSAFITAA